MRRKRLGTDRDDDVERVRIQEADVPNADIVDEDGWSFYPQCPSCGSPISWRELGSNVMDLDCRDCDSHYLVTLTG